MKKNDKKWLYYLIANLVIILCMVGAILFTLTYRTVPVDQQHYFWGGSLHDYLCCLHTLITCVSCGACVFTNILIFTKL